MFGKKINWVTFSVLVFLPLFVVLLAAIYMINFGFGSKELILLLVSYYIANISVGVGFHRLWSHNAYKTNKFVEFILVLLTAGTLQGPVLAWASDHRRHHSYTDEKDDPHSPLRFENKWKGFFWSHMGWMLVGESSYKHLDKITLKKIGNNKLLVWQLKYYWQVATFMNVVMPILFGLLLDFSVRGAVAGVVFVGLGRAIQQQVTFFVNSVCHFFGTKKYVDGTAGDIWWLALLLLGENWHNFHHAFARDYRNGHKWYHFDVHKWIIYSMYKLGLASDLVITPEERIVAKSSDVTDTIIQTLSEKLSLIEGHARVIAKNAEEKLSFIEKSAGDVANSLYCKVLEMKVSSERLAIKSSTLIKNLKIKHKDIIQDFYEKLELLEKTAVELGLLDPSSLRKKSITI